ncbi:MAG: formylglycine-generating enzyme family protein [Chitinispirillia bacterium]|nr:formylglycine-generating enzyme family protein [Chitinispirillia bacterium]
MSGNVWEMCSDWYGPYEAGRQVNPKGPLTGTRRVTRGGSWNDADAKWCSISSRGAIPPRREGTGTDLSRSNRTGFRLALDP